jgi:transposase
VEDGPIPAVHGVVRWRLIDLAQWVFDAFRVSFSKQTLSRELRAMGFRKLSARPRHHAQDEEAAAAFEKNFTTLMEETAARQACGKPIEIWFKDEARVGQKNKITRHWAKRGTRPSAPNDQRTASAYIFGAICPAEGKGAGLVLPSCNSEAMALHREEISLAVAPGAHALVLLDQTGWHVSKKLPIPGNITLVPLPPKSLELNPVENIWQFMRDTWLSNRVFESSDDILDHCCFAWNIRAPSRSGQAPSGCGIQGRQTQAQRHIPDRRHKSLARTRSHPAVSHFCCGLPLSLESVLLMATCKLVRRIGRPSHPCRSGAEDIRRGIFIRRMRM